MRVGRCFLLVTLSSTQEDWHRLLDLVRLLGSLSSDRTVHSPSVEETIRGEHVAVIGEPPRTFPLNHWLIVGNQTNSSPHTPMTSSKSHASHMTWTTLRDHLLTNGGNMGHSDQLSIANEIHCLLDHIPWDFDDYVLVDVLLLVPVTCRSLSPLPALYGALWRLKKWLNSSISFIVEENSICSEWVKWSECLQACTGTRTNIAQTLSEPVIWRGALHVQEYRRKMVSTQRCVRFPGFKLSLEDSKRMTVEELAGLCISSVYHPTYLDVIQLVDLSEISLIWLSCLRLNLSVNSSPSSASSAVFKELFQQSSGTGVLLRLCGRSPVREHALSFRTTQDWKTFVLEQESMADSPIPPSISSTGPILLVTSHSSHSSERCQAWLLHRPERLHTVANILFHLQSHPISTSEASNGGALWNQLPLLNTTKTISYPLGEEFLDTSSDPLISIKCPELVALTSYEDHIKKKIKRTNTSDLTLGGVTAPPPGSGSSVPFASDILSCFTDTGHPVPSLDLLPVPLDDSEGRSHSIHMIDPETASSVSYSKILSSTPTRVRKYHGVSYCLSEEDKTRDDKLAKLQQRYIPKERSSNCSNYRTPRKSQQWRKRRLLHHQTTGETLNENNENETTAHVVVSNIQNEIGLVSNTENEAASTAKRSLVATTTNNAETSTINSSITHTHGAAADIETQLDDNIHCGNQTRFSACLISKTRPREIDISSKSSSSTKCRVTDVSTSSKPKPSNTSLHDTTALQLSTNVAIEPANDPAVACSVKTSSGNEDTKWTTKAIKKYLEGTIVASLKAHGMKRSHSLFHKCYLKLFRISKMFVKDLNPASDIEKQIKKIVGNSVKQVVEFELDQASAL